MTTDKATEQEEPLSKEEIEQIESELQEGAKIDLLTIRKNLNRCKRMMLRCDAKITLYTAKLDRATEQRSNTDKSLMEKALDLFSLKKKIHFRR